MEIAKCEEKVSDSSNNNNGDKAKENNTNEQEKEDIFGKFKNMWGGR